MKKPLIVYTFALILSYITAFLILNDKILGAAMVSASFFILIFILTNSNKFRIITIAFFLIGFANYSFYFNNIDFLHGDIFEIRIIKKQGYNYIGSCKGKKILISGNIKNLEEGQLAILEGSFEKSPAFSDGIVGKIVVDKIKGNKQDIVSKMYSCKEYIYNEFEEKLGGEKASIISGACFGDVKNIDKEKKRELNQLGILHVVSVSGLHLAIIYKIAEKLLGIYGAVTFALAFTLFTGGQAATFRAFIMILVLKLSKKLYRNYDAYTSLALSAFILLVVSPYNITDIGFILSFLSMLGIFLCFDKVNRKLIFLPNALNETISLSLSAQFLTAPFIMGSINSFSLGFLIGNIALIPFYSILVVIGTLSAILIKIKPLFNLLVFGLDILLEAVLSGTELLLEFCPPIIYLSFTTEICIIVIYISYIMTKRGIKQYLFLPLFLIVPLFMENYAIFPELSYIRYYDKKVVVLNYKEDKLMIVDKKDKGIIKDDSFLLRNKITDTYIKDEEYGDLNLSNLKLDFLPSTEKKNFPVITLDINNRKVIINTENTLQRSYVLQNYDIINISLEENNETYQLVKNVKILFNRFYLVF